MNWLTLMPLALGQLLDLGTDAGQRSQRIGRRRLHGGILFNASRGRGRPPMPNSGGTLRWRAEGCGVEGGLAEPRTRAAPHSPLRSHFEFAKADLASPSDLDPMQRG
jgi:hypothetical protein